MTPHGLPLVLLVSVTFGKYVYVGEKMHWDKAQDYCRRKYTDLAPISNEYDANLLFDDPNIPKRVLFWIGLMRDPSDGKRWLWSGGDEVKQTFWHPGEPNNYKGKEDRAGIRGDLTWNDAVRSKTWSFFCYRVHTVRERKTWEEALDYCRSHHCDLASVASKTELMLMQRELGKAEITEQVWIGLRFLAGDWQWVDGQPLEYEAWGPGGKPWCPALQGCAALQVTGTSQLISGTKVVDTIVKDWNVRSCDEELYFLCY